MQDINIRLIEAVKNGSVSEAAICLVGGANVNHRFPVEDGHCTPLAFAISTHSEGVVSLLLNWPGIDCEIESTVKTDPTDDMSNDFVRLNPFTQALETKKPELVKLLVKHGVNIFTQDYMSKIVELTRSPETEARRAAFEIQTLFANILAGAKIWPSAYQNKEFRDKKSFEFSEDRKSKMAPASQTEASSLRAGKK